MNAGDPSYYEQDDGSDQLRRIGSEQARLSLILRLAVSIPLAIVGGALTVAWLGNFGAIRGYDAVDAGRAALIDSAFDGWLDAPGLARTYDNLSGLFRLNPVKYESVARTLPYEEPPSDIVEVASPATPYKQNIWIVNERNQGPGARILLNVADRIDPNAFLKAPLGGGVGGLWTQKKREVFLKDTYLFDPTDEAPIGPAPTDREVADQIPEGVGGEMAPMDARAFLESVEVKFRSGRLPLLKKDFLGLGIDVEPLTKWRIFPLAQAETYENYRLAGFDDKGDLRLAVSADTSGLRLRYWPSKRIQVLAGGTWTPNQTKPSGLAYIVAGVLLLVVAAVVLLPALAASFRGGNEY
jgi:hypothetical protein